MELTMNGHATKPVQVRVLSKAQQKMWSFLNDALSHLTSYVN